MEQNFNPNEKITPEKMQEYEKLSQELDKMREDLDAKRDQLYADFPDVKGGMTPEMEIRYEKRKAQYLEELDAYIEKLEVHQQMAEEQRDEAVAQLMESVEEILRKMLIAAEKDPSLRGEVDEWVESYKQVTGREDIFDV